MSTTVETPQPPGLVPSGRGDKPLDAPAGEQRVGLAADKRRRRWGKRPALTLSVICPAVIAFGVCLYQLLLPNVLLGYHEYDDGAYLGSALRLVHGLVPYRDFVLVQPPGIVLLMAPIAALSGGIETQGSLGLARDITLLVTVMNCVFVALAVRHRGWVASLVAGTALACFPMAPAADQTLLLEPYLVFFCLVALLLLSGPRGLAVRYRLLLAGTALGFAGAVKIWAFLVVLAVVAVVASKSRRALVPLLAGTAAGFALPCLPFFVLAPHNFVHEVLGDQFGRALIGTAPFPAGERVSWLTGMGGLTLFHPPGAVAVCLGLSFVVFVGAVFVVQRRSIAPVEWLVLAAAAVIVAAMFLPNEFYAHYVYFPAAFLAMLLGISVAAGLDECRRHGGLLGSLARPNHVLVACVVAAGFLVPQQAAYAQSHLADAQSEDLLSLVIPQGSCVVSAIASVSIAAGLFDPSQPGCPPMVDSFGTWLADGPPEQPPYAGPYPTAFVNEWSRWLSKAAYVIEDAPYSAVIPWTPALRSWFKTDFKLLYAAADLSIYQHQVITPPPVMPSVHGHRR